MQDNSANNKRLAKNTLVLYLRTIFVMVISLYTSRVILNTLGVEDYGIYNAVGGMVAMFAVVSSALSSAISRFITFELGTGNKEKLKIIFSTSVNIQLALSIIILILGETVGLWFLNTKMNIPYDRIGAANWVLHFSLISFCVNLISVPYNACIIAHERMTVFAYIGIVEALLKLLVCYLIIISSFDKLIVYSFLLLVIAVIIRITYGIYCGRSFEESKYKFVYDKQIFKEMSGFAGWSFLTNATYIFNTQGVNLLINIFFGVALNAARGIVNQVEHAVMQFVNNFTTAINPQITKSYAAGDTQQVFSLICSGAKFSYYLMLLFTLPLVFETESILTLWLKNVPDYSVAFLRLSLVASMIHVIGNTGVTACMATGNIRRYVIWVTSAGFLVFPLTWIVFELGAPAETTYIVFIVVYIVVHAVRLYIMKSLLNFPPMRFVKEVVLPILIVTVVSTCLSYLLIMAFPPTLYRVGMTLLICSFMSLMSIYFVGLTTNEREMIKKTILNKIHSKKKK